MAEGHRCLSYYQKQIQHPLSLHHKHNKDNININNINTIHNKIYLHFAIKVDKTLNFVQKKFNDNKILFDNIYYYNMIIYM